MSRYTIYVLLILAAMFFVSSLDQYLDQLDARDRGAQRGKP